MKGKKNETGLDSVFPAVYQRLVGARRFTGLRMQVNLLYPITVSNLTGVCYLQLYQDVDTPWPPTYMSVRCVTWPHGHAFVVEKVCIGQTCDKYCWRQQASWILNSVRTTSFLHRKPRPSFWETVINQRISNYRCQIMKLLETLIPNNFQSQKKRLV